MMDQGGSTNSGSQKKQRNVNFKWRSLFSMMALGLVGEPMLVMINPPAVMAQSIPRVIREGYTNLSRGWVDDAIAAFEEAVQQYPNSVPARTGLAIAYRRAGRDEEAWNAYRAVLEIDPNNELVLKTLGFLGTYRQEWQDEAIEALTRLLSINANDLEARAQRALLYSYQAQFDSALADYEIVLESNPTPNVLLGAAQAYTYSGNPQQGLELFNRYLATGESITGYATIAYGRALRATGNPAQAARALETELQGLNTLNDQAIQLRSELAQAYLANQQPERALAVVEPLRGRSEAILPLARSLNEIGRQANQASLSEEAAQLYLQALNRNPNPSPSLVREVADVLSGVPSQRRQALQLYEQLVAQQTNDPTLVVQKLALQNELGLIAKGELRQELRETLQSLPANARQRQRIAQALIRIDPPDPDLLPIYQSLLAPGVNVPFLNFRVAQILIERNDLTGARQALGQYLENSDRPEEDAVELVLADIERREGKFQASAERYQALLSSEPPEDVLAGALRGLASVRISQGRSSDALALYDRLISLKPDDVALQLGRAAIAYESEAIDSFQAQALLNQWLRTQPPTNTPPELFSLVSTLPASPQREYLYNILLQADPNNIPINLRLIEVIAARNPAQAKARVRQLITENPDNLGVYFVQGQLGQILGELEMADQAYQTVLARQPDNTDALSALGGVRFQQREYERAEDLYTQVLELDPDNLVARRSLAGLTAVQDRPLAALEQIEQLQLEQMANGGMNPALSRQQQQIEEGFLRRRGFQPPWERY